MDDAVLDDALRILAENERLARVDAQRRRRREQYDRLGLPTNATPEQVHQAITRQQ